MVSGAREITIRLLSRRERLWSLGIAVFNVIITPFVFIRWGWVVAGVWLLLTVRIANDSWLGVWVVRAGTRKGDDDEQCWRKEPDDGE